eukprot:jgi/Tetstr1/459195/TSEL_004639.t1
MGRSPTHHVLDPHPGQCSQATAVVRGRLPTPGASGLPRLPPPASPPDFPEQTPPRPQPARVEEEEEEEEQQQEEEEWTVKATPLEEIRCGRGAASRPETDSWLFRPRAARHARRVIVEEEEEEKEEEQQQQEEEEWTVKATPLEEIRRGRGAASRPETESCLFQPGAPRHARRVIVEEEEEEQEEEEEDGEWTVEATPLEEIRRGRGAAPRHETESCLFRPGAPRHARRVIVEEEEEEEEEEQGEWTVKATPLEEIRRGRGSAPRPETESCLFRPGAPRHARRVIVEEEEEEEQEVECVPQTPEEDLPIAEAAQDAACFTSPQRPPPTETRVSTLAAATATGRVPAAAAAAAAAERHAAAGFSRHDIASVSAESREVRRAGLQRGGQCRPEPQAGHVGARFRGTSDALVLSTVPAPGGSGGKLCAAPAPDDLCAGGHAVAFARTSRGEEQGHGKDDWRSNNKIAGQLHTLAREYANLGGDTADGDRFRCLAEVGPAYQRMIAERLILAGPDGAAGTLNRLATAAAAAGAPSPVFMACAFSRLTLQGLPQLKEAVGMLGRAGARAVVVLVPAGVGCKLLEHKGFPDTEAAIADYIAADVACSLGQQFYTARHLVTARVVQQIASGLLPRTSPERALFRAAAAAGRFTHVLYVGRISPVAHNRRLQTEWHADNEQRSPHLQTEFCEVMLGEGLAPTLRGSDRIGFLDNSGTSVGAADGAYPACVNLPDATATRKS